MSLDCEERPLNANSINDSHASGTMDSLVRFMKLNHLVCPAQVTLWVKLDGSQ